MPHIPLLEGVPGIRGPMIFSPDTAKPLSELVQILLTGAHTLTPAEREMIATYVSSENDCYYCQPATVPLRRNTWEAPRPITNLSRR
jgi:alkylhydroperoxidase family enzyme